jgi:glycosyltransferase involved in cell wall biosynthesis
LAWFSLIKLLFEKLNRFDRIISTSNSLLLIYSLFVICKIRKIPFIQEKSEFPFVLNKKSIFGKLYAKFYIYTTLKMYNGMIVMTNPLNDYLTDKISSSCKRILLPMTVDNTRFLNVNKENKYGTYIAYCGDVGCNKDGVKNLIHAFSLIENKFTSLKLLIIGGSRDKLALSILKEYVSFLKAKNILFLGKVNRDEIPPLLCNAKILALARPKSLQSSGGFPTKLGEYLSTGNPVLVTSVGEIPFYLKDGENAFLVPPDDDLAFAEKISYILEYYEDAIRVAYKGKILSETVFNYMYQSERLQEFLENLN